MKTTIITLLLFASVSWASAQEINTGFYMGADSVQVYDYSRKIAAKSIFLDDTFEDDYNLKITNKAYKIRLNIPPNMEQKVQELTSRVLDGNAATKGFKVMVWKKNKGSKNEMYEVRIAKGKLRFKATRQYMDKASYALLTELGQRFIQTIKE